MTWVHAGGLKTLEIRSLRFVVHRSIVNTKEFVEWNAVVDFATEGLRPLALEGGL